MIDPIEVLTDPSYGVITEVRHPQRDLAKTILDAMETLTPLVAEAGTGVGKSYAYLLNALWYLAQNPGCAPIIVCTAVKSLQQQLIFKDLPRLRDLLFPSLTFARVIGKGNYLCKRLVEQNELNIPSTKKKLRIYEDFFDTVPNWVIDDAPDNLRLPDDHWKHAVAYCNGERCGFFQECTDKGYLAAKNNAKTANILVANHAVLASDVRLITQDKKPMLPAQLSFVIFDEAHRLPEILRNQLACDLTEKYFERTATRYETLFGDAAADLVHFSKTKCYDLLPETLPSVPLLATAYRDMHREVRTGRLNTFGPSAQVYAKRCRAVVQELQESIGVGGSNFSRWASGNHQGEVQSALIRFPRNNPALTAVLSELNTYSATLEDHARSIEIIRSSDRSDARSSYVLGISKEQEDGASEDQKLQVLPLRLGRPLAAYLHRKNAVPIYLSATLAVRSSFHGFVNELGIDMRIEQISTLETPSYDEDTWLNTHKLEAVTPGGTTFAKFTSNNRVNTFISSSPFDYAKQAVLYLPEGLKDPSVFGRPNTSTHQDYIQELVVTSLPLLAANEGHAFVLFTNRTDLSAFEQELRHNRYPYPILSQCADSRLKSRGRDMFNATPHATLLGLRTFFEGIDIPGLGLSLVIIPKLPLPFPTPVLTAKKAEYESYEGFNNVDVPVMLTDLRQMAGRLIRSTEDRGVLAVLDPRIRTKRYGAVAVEELGFPVQRSKESAVVAHLLKITAKRKAEAGR